MDTSDDSEEVEGYTYHLDFEPPEHFSEAYITSVYVGEDDPIDPDLCDQILEYAKTLGGEPAETGSGVEADIRSATTWSVTDYSEENEFVWDLVEEFAYSANAWEFDIRVVDTVEILQYQVGNYYTAHTDWSESYGLRKLSVVLGLTEGHEGGELEIYDCGDWVTLDLGKGDWAAFPSFVPHRVKTVTSGERWSMVLWFEGAPFR